MVLSAFHPCLRSCMDRAEERKKKYSREVANMQPPKVVNGYVQGAFIPGIELTGESIIQIFLLAFYTANTYNTVNKAANCSHNIHEK